MKRQIAAKTAACVAALFAGSAAIADVTAEDVWNDMKSQLSVYGESGVSIGSEDRSGDTLTVTDLELSMEEDDGFVHAVISKMTFTENGDGTVSVSVPSEIPVLFGEGTKADGNLGTVLIRSESAEVTVSGDPENMNFDVTADRYTISLDEVYEDGEAIPVNLLLDVAGISASQSVVDDGDLRSTSFEVTVESIDVLMDADDDATSVNMNGQFSDLDFSGDVTIPSDFDPEVPEEMFQNGFELDIAYTLGAAEISVAVDDDGELFDMTASVGATEVEVAFDADRLAVAESVHDVAISALSSALPLPIDFSIGEYGLSLDVPLARTKSPADFGFSFDLIDLSVNEMIWAMVDPAGALSHDPATLQIDLSGTAKLFFDLLDPSMADAIENADVPGEIYSLSLDDLKISAAGALLTGGGSFEFDNTDLETFDGLPRPEGEVTVEGQGLNGLIDTLATMGLIPEDQLMGARMMLGMFSNVIGDDHVSTTVQVNDQGHLIVNEQRLK